MYKTVNGNGPEICKEPFHDISRIHGHATRSAVKGDLFVQQKQLVLPSKQSQLQAQGYGA